jgi:mono/diheme cytochrome c family protein
MKVINAIFMLIFLAACQSQEGNPNPVAAPAGLSRIEKVGKNLYDFYCVSCHGERGEGDGIHSYSLDPPPANLADTAYTNTLSDEQLFDVISLGGAGVGKSPAMPPWKQVLSENQIRCIIAYLRLLPAIANASAMEE